MPTELDIDGQHWYSHDEVLDPEVLLILENPAYLDRYYVSPSGSKVEFLALFSRDNRKGIHPPDLCIKDIVEKREIVLHGVPPHGDVPCRALIAGSGNQYQYFLYVYKCGGRYTPSFWKQQFFVFVNGLLQRNASGGLIRVSTPVGEDVETAQRRCMTMLSTAIPYLDAALP